MQPLQNDRGVEEDVFRSLDRLSALGELVAAEGESLGSTTEAMAGLGGLTGLISHELAQVFLVLFGRLEQCRELARGDERLAAAIEECRVCSVRGLRITRAILAAARVGTMTGGETVGLAVAVEAALSEVFGSEAADRVVVEGDGLGDTVVAIEGVKLHHVMTNLLENASRASEGAADRIRVRVIDATCNIDSVVLEVVNAIGVGTGRVTDGSDRAGLGLKLCRLLLEGSGGELSVGKDVGGRYVARLTLPRAATAPKAAMPTR